VFAETSAQAENSEDAPLSGNDDLDAEESNNSNEGLRCMDWNGPLVVEGRGLCRQVPIEQH
jgi:hypothetical protein